MNSIIAIVKTPNAIIDVRQVEWEGKGGRGKRSEEDLSILFFYFFIYFFSQGGGGVVVSH